NNMIAVDLKEIEDAANASLGVAGEGARAAGAGGAGGPGLPGFDSLDQQGGDNDVFKRARRLLAFTGTASGPWIVLRERRGMAGKDKRLWVRVDWSKGPRGISGGKITIAGAGSSVVVDIEAFNPVGVTRNNLRGFAEGQGEVSIEPEHYSKKNDSGDYRWIRV